VTTPSVRHLDHAGTATTGLAALAGRTGSALQTSPVVWLALMAYVVLIKVVFDAFLPAAIAAPDQRDAFSWPLIGVLGSLGLVGVLLMQRTGFPSALDARVSTRKRLLVPALLGLGLGVLHILIEIPTGFAQLNSAAHGVAQQYTGLLPTLLFFSAAPVLVESLYRFIPIPVLLWLVSNVMLRGRGQTQVFWALALLTSLLEPLQQTSVVSGIGPVVFGAVVGRGFALNLVEALCFRRYGFIAPIVVRETFYLVWHVLYVH
jgi:hypothetical protein